MLGAGKVDNWQLTNSRQSSALHDSRKLCQLIIMFAREF